MSISLLVPTRGRPSFFGAMLESVRTTAAASGIEVVAYVDVDDPAVGLYQNYLEGFHGVDLHLITGPRIVLSQAWNECAAAASGQYLMLAADDIRFRHPGWAGEVERVFAALPDGIGYLYGRDGHWDHMLGTHGIVSRTWVEVVGYFCPPHFASDKNDAWLHDVARMVGRAIYLPRLYTEHLHPAFGKAPQDATHQERMTRHRAADVDLLYFSMADLRRHDAQKLLDHMLEVGGG